MPRIELSTPSGIRDMQSEVKTHIGNIVTLGARHLIDTATPTDTDWLIGNPHPNQKPQSIHIAERTFDLKIMDEEWGETEIQHKVITAGISGKDEYTQLTTWMANTSTRDSSCISEMTSHGPNSGTIRTNPTRTKGCRRRSR